MGSIAINQILSLGLTVDENVDVVYEILFCESQQTIDGFVFDRCAWEFFFSDLMK
jgi:hypothetical protein